MTTAVTTSPEISAFADPIMGGIERIIRCLDGQDALGLNWRPPAAETNSLAILAAHMMGSAEWFILNLLGGQPIVRDREAEFATHVDAAEPLFAQWTNLQPRLRAALNALPPTMLDTIYEHPALGPMSGRRVLIFIAQHTAEHAGHAELTRDLLNATRV